MKKLAIIATLASLAALLNCSALKKKESDDNSGLLALLAASGNLPNANCASSAATAITSKLSQVTNPARTQYKISECSTAGLAAIGLTSLNVTTGATGTSSSSLLASTSAMTIDTAKGGTNIEVTFMLNSSSASLDVIAYGSGTTPSISGPTYRLAAGSQPQYKKSSDGSFATVSKGSATTTSTLAAGTSYTYCLDFQYTSSGMRYLNGWEKACSQVTSTERGSMMYYPLMVMMNVPSYTSGSSIGFVLNNATITSFTVGTIISETE